MAAKEAAQLPLAKIKTIMKSSPDVESIGSEAVFLMSKAAELFVTYLTSQAYYKGEGEDNKSIEYSNLANVVNNDEDDVFGFLQEIIPRKITVREYFELVRRDQGGNLSSDD